MPSCKVGDLVMIRYSQYDRVPVIALLGPLGPGGTQVYRIRLRGKPRPKYAEVLSDQMILVERPEPRDAAHPNNP